MEREGGKKNPKPHQSETVIKHKTITNSVRKEKSICAFEMHLCIRMKETPEIQDTRTIYLAFRGEEKKKLKNI